MTTEDRVLASLSLDGRWHVMDSLAEQLHVPRRAIEDAIQQLRLDGHPVVGGDNGVKLSNDSLELRAYAHSRRNRALAIARGTRSLIHTANRMEGRTAGQRTLWKEVA